MSPGSAFLEVGFAFLHFSENLRSSVSWGKLEVTEKNVPRKVGRRHCLRKYNWVTSQRKIIFRFISSSSGSLFPALTPFRFTRVWCVAASHVLQSGSGTQAGDQIGRGSVDGQNFSDDSRTWFFHWAFESAVQLFYIVIPIWIEVSFF